MPNSFHITTLVTARVIVPEGDQTIDDLRAQSADVARAALEDSGIIVDHIDTGNIEFTAQDGADHA